jgi:GPH family glycoside/pentoside/hexuronide:cation symporter
MTATVTAARPPVSLPTKVLYGLGAVANAVKARGLSTFLLIFYNQVVGLPPQMVSTAIFFALIFDAFVDPLVGQISDNFRSPWGRRHPFMYFAALPVSVAYFMIWNPPALSDQAELFAYMLSCLLVIRLFDTFFELPSTALAPELATEYNDRTSLIAIRSLFQVVGGLGMTLLAYQVFMREHADGSGGITDRAGYFNYSLTAGILIFVVILVSTAGTHGQIPYLRQPPTRKVSFKVMVAEVAATLSNRSFVVAAMAGMFIAIAAGMKNGLELYFYLYYWQLDQAQLSILTTVGVAASVAGVALAPRVAGALGKKHGAIVMFIGALAIGVAPLGLSLIGLMPPAGSDLLFYILVGDTFLNAAMAVMTGVMLASMMADVVEDSEVKTGRRSEGLLFSADNLFKKVVSGAGVFISGSLLMFVNFPDNAKRGAVDPEVLRHLALIFLPTAFVLYGVAIICLFAFKIDKATHEDNLRRLKDSVALADLVGADLEAGGAAGLAGGAAPVAPRA